VPHLNEYQHEALKTAIYPIDRELDYTVLGLLSEVGELGEAYAAGKIDDWGFTNLVIENLFSEAGDCYWYVAAVADALNAALDLILLEVEDDRLNFTRSRGLTVLEITRASGAIAGFVKKAIRDNDGYLSDKGREGIKQELGVIFLQLDHLATLFGGTGHAIRAKNLNKLADRAARGVLAGSGNTR